MCFHKQNTESFLKGLLLVFEFFDGVVRRVLFDNAKVVVKMVSALAFFEESLNSQFLRPIMALLAYRLIV